MFDAASRRSASVDLVVWAFACRADLDELTADELRAAVSEFLFRHDLVLSHLSEGGDPVDLVHADVLPFWPEFAEVLGGLPRDGAELYPLAVAALQDLDANVVAAAAPRVLVELSPHAQELSFSAEVAVEILEALAFAALVHPINA